MTGPDGSGSAHDDRFRFARALFAFLVLPGISAFLVPLLLAPDHPDPRPVHWVGALMIAIGTAILLWCVKEFYVLGKGTLAPWSPPRNLVMTGLYRWSRNPMYVGVSLIVFGWAIWFMSRGLLIYAVALAIAFHLRVVLGEEPWLARTHGEAWVKYRQSVPRWFGFRVQ